MQKVDNDSVVLPDSVPTDDLYEEETGALVFESAMMRFFAEADQEKIESFEAFVTLQVTSLTFMEDLCLEFPEFEKILLQEIEIINNDLLSVYPKAKEQN